MASFALGNVAAGFEQARQADLQRQFEQEQNKRNFMGQSLLALAGNENIHPDVRNAAFQSYLQIPQLDFRKPMKMQNLMEPVAQAYHNVMQGQQAQAQQLQQFTPPPGHPAAYPQGQQVGAAGAQVPVFGNPPASTVGDLALQRPGAAPGAGTAMGPPVPPEWQGIARSPEAQTAFLAQRTGALTGAEAGAQAKQFVMQQNPQGGFSMVPVSGTGQPIGQPVENAFNPMMFRAMAGMLHPVTYTDPQTGAPMLGMQNKLTNEVMDQAGNVVPNAQAFNAQILPQQSTSTESMSPSGAISHAATRTRVLQGAGGPPVQSAPPPPPETTQLPSYLGGGTIQQGQQQAAPAKQGKQIGRAKQAAAPPQGQQAGHFPSAPEDWSKLDPITREAYQSAMGLAAMPTNIMAKRQVEQRMSQLGLAPATPVPAAQQRQIREQFEMRNSAINLIDDIMKHKNVFDSLLSQAKISVAVDSNGNGITQQMAGLNDTEAQVAGDFKQLVEHANLLRGPLGASGFRGHEAWQALQAQRGQPLGDPRITQQTLAGMKDRLMALNSADKFVLPGLGQGAGTPQQNAPAGLRILTQADIAKAAKDHGISVEEATRQAKAAGHTIQ